MRRALTVLAASLAALSVAYGQDDPRPAAPYRPVAVTIPTPADPEGLTAFRRRLTALADEKDSDALQKVVVERNLFWDGDSENTFDRKKSAFENFRAALGFDQDEGNIGWSNLARLAAYPVVPHERRRNVFCGPGHPEFSDEAFDKLLEDTSSEAAEWAAPRAPELKVRLHPRDDGPVIETLGMHLVLIDGAEEPKATDPRTWSIVMTPRGKRGYVLASDLVELFGDRLCYAKDAAGAWRITGYVGSEG